MKSAACRARTTPCIQCHRAMLSLSCSATTSICHLHCWVSCTVSSYSYLLGVFFSPWHTSYTFQQLTFFSSAIFLSSGLDFSFTVIALCCSVLLFLTIHFPAHLCAEPQCSPSLTLTRPPLTAAALLVSHTTVLASSSSSHTKHPTWNAPSPAGCHTAPPLDGTSASDKQAEFHKFHTHLLLLIAHLPDFSR